MRPHSKTRISGAIPSTPRSGSAAARGRARGRPRYTWALVALLAVLSPGPALALDCATGNGPAISPAWTYPLPSIASTRVTLRDVLALPGPYRAIVRLERAEGLRPVDAITSDLGIIWGGSGRRLQWRWGLSLRLAHWGPARLTLRTAP